MPQKRRPDRPKPANIERSLPVQKARDPLQWPERLARATLLFLNFSFVWQCADARHGHCVASQLGWGGIGLGIKARGDNPFFHAAPRTRVEIIEKLLASTNPRSQSDNLPRSHI